MRLRRLTRKTCPRTGGHWFVRQRMSWAQIEAGRDDYQPPARKSRKHRRREQLRKAWGRLPMPAPTPRLAMDDPERAALYAEVRAVGACEYCGSRYRLTVDHIVPLALGGGNHRANLQCLCKRCNEAKGLHIWGPGTLFPLTAAA